MLLSFGALVSLILGGGDPGITASNPGLNKLVTAGGELMKFSFSMLRMYHWIAHRVHVHVSIS